jgi:hypothetical protein
MPIPLALVAVAATAAGAAGAFGGGQDAPDPRNYAQETRDTLQAKIDLAPQQFAAESQFRPLYNNLNMEEYRAALLGRPAGKRSESYVEQVPYETTEQYDRNGNVINTPAGYSVTAPGYGSGVSTRTVTRYRPETRTREVDLPAQEGLLDMFQNEIAPKTRQIQTADREADIADIQNLGPKTNEALRVANPGAASIVDALVNRANANLAGGLDPAEERQLQQTARAGQAARGMGYGLPDLFEELMGAGVGGQELIRNRAAQALSASEGFYGNPFETILQRNSGKNAGSAAGATATGLNGSSGPSLFNPESAYAQDVNNTNYNAQSAAAISSRNNQAALLSALTGALGTAGGAYFGSL